MSMRVRVSVVIGERCNLRTNRDKVITLSLIDVDRIVRALEKIYSRFILSLRSKFEKCGTSYVSYSLKHFEISRCSPGCCW